MKGFLLFSHFIDGGVTGVSMLLAAAFNLPLAAVFILGTEPALYSMLTYFAASRVMEFVLNGIEQYTGVTIVSEQSETIRLAITEGLGRGVTLY